MRGLIQRAARMLAVVVTTAGSVVLAGLVASAPASAHGAHMHGSVAATKVWASSAILHQVGPVSAGGARTCAAPRAEEVAPAAVSNASAIDRPASHIPACDHVPGAGTCCGAACHGGSVVVDALPLLVPSVWHLRVRTPTGLRVWADVTFGLMRPPIA